MKIKILVMMMLKKLMVLVLTMKTTVAMEVMLRKQRKQYRTEIWLQRQMKRTMIKKTLMRFE